ncbi:MAG: molecular chaperone TorD family protein [Acidimicrobiia bacterium]
MTTATQERIEAAIRADVYGFLARVVPYPKAVPDVGSLRHVEFEDRALDECRIAIVEASDTDLASLQAAHRVLFPAVESQDAPSYETAYSKHDVFRQGQVMADVAGFYRAHGLKQGGERRDRPDGVGSELEFLGFLALKQALALSEGELDNAAFCVETQALFLQDHVGGWVPDYGRRVAAVSDHPFYVAFGNLLALWLEAEMDSMDVVPGEPDLGAAMGPDGIATAVADPKIRWDEVGFSCGEPL